ncbi:hypothetical protein F4811DRAFT_521986 [Daldinia bambusicola]|nr:hypothetical protein F4811DRAFT_521986 [Daldinia bambusicola]
MPRYTRDEYVAIINDFYTFLTRMHIADSALEHPPDEGWRNITPEKCSGFGKTAFVIDLLKHLPYIQGGMENDVDIHYKCNVVDYSALTPEDFGSAWIKYGEIAASASADGPVPVPVPAHTVVLARGHESGGRDLLLDTERGSVIEEAIRFQRCGEWDVAEYFEELRRKYEALEMFHIPGTETVQWMEHGYDEKEMAAAAATHAQAPLREGEFFPTEEDVRWVRYLYKSYGWPRPEFRRDECLEAIARYKAMREGVGKEEEEEE